MTRLRITVRGENVELRGYLDDRQILIDLAKAVEGTAVVVASPAEDDYNPFVPPGYDSGISVPPEWAGQ